MPGTWRDIQISAIILDQHISFVKRGATKQANTFQRKFSERYGACDCLGRMKFDWRGRKNSTYAGKQRDVRIGVYSGRSKCRAE